MNVYYGYCYLPDETHTPSVKLAGEEAAISYVHLQKPLQHKVIIVDTDDCIVIEAIDGKIVFPIQE